MPWLKAANNISLQDFRKSNELFWVLNTGVQGAPFNLAKVNAKCEF
jgi:hypothetical protein